MSYDIEFRGVSIGRLRIEVGQAGALDGKPVIVMRSQVDSSGLVAIVRNISWQLESVIDTTTGLPISTESIWSSEVEGRPERGRELRHSPEIHDMHSLIALVRAWEPAPGARMSARTDIGGKFSVVFGPATRQYSRRLQAATLRIEGVAEIGAERRFTVWVSDDSRRLPLRIEMSTKWGSATIRLLGYDGPGRDGDLRTRALSPI